MFRTPSKASSVSGDFDMELNSPRRVERTFTKLRSSLENLASRPALVEDLLPDENRVVETTMWTVEGRELHNEAMEQLAKSGNIKREIKITLTRCIDNLYDLLKKSEELRQKQVEEVEERMDEIAEEERKEVHGRIKAKLDGKDSEVLREIREVRRMMQRQAEEKEWDSKKRNEEKLIEAQKMEKLIKKMETNEEKGKKRIEELMKRVETKETKEEANIEEIKRIMEKKEEKEKGRLEEVIRKMENKNEESKEKLEVIMNTIKDRDTAGPKTYAGVAATKTANRRPTLHSVLITSKEETDTSEMLIGKLRKVVNAREEGLRVDKIRKAKERKVIIGCERKEDMQKVINRIRKEGKELEMEEVKNKNPLVVLMDVLSYNSDEDIISAIMKQNNQLIQGLSEEEQKVEVCFRKKARNPLTGHVVLRVSPVLWKRMTEAGALHIDLQRVKVLDQSPLVQCTKCLGYGHSKKLCEEKADSCSHCGEEHLSRDCESRRVGRPPQCCNCTRQKMEKRAHNAFSGECPIRQKWDEIARSSVAYH
jgi:hypothetical protein